MKNSQTAKYILKKAVQLVLSLLVLSIIVFFVSRLAPGDPLKAYYGETVERMSQEQLSTAEERLGLNDPLIIQYADWLSNAVKGDFGISYQYKQPAVDVIGQVFGNTAALAIISFILIFILGLLLAVFCVKREGKPIDKIICRIGVATNSIPEFFVALILILIFAVSLNILPQSGANSVGMGTASFGSSGGFVILTDRIIHLILPVSAIVISHLWYCTYLMRNKLSDEMSKDYILMLKVKGLSQNRIIYRHCLKNIMPACISIMAIFLPHLLGGAYVIEMVFSYPGLGRLGVESAQLHDYNMLMLVCLITGAMVITANIIAQIINEKLSPEMKEERGRLI
ncbi:MAG: ABC transporter permease [Firmicutes bacterium]|nr:ABC transporter permease [Bacillota bacterium]